MKISVNKHMVEHPDVVVRITKGESGLPPFAYLEIDEVTLFPNHFMHDIPAQLAMFEQMGQRIIDAAKAARPDIPRSAA